MLAQGRTDLPRWLSSSSVAAIGTLLAVFAIALSGAFIWYERREIHAHELQGTEMYARVLQDHAERTFNTVDVVLAAASESLRDAAAPADPQRLGQLLSHAQQGLPFVRSLSVVDGQGHVLGSSTATNLGVQVDPDRLPMPPPGVPERLGALILGRDLSDVARLSTSPSARAPNAHTFIPLVRSISDGGGAPLFLVAALNPDFFANEYSLMLFDADRAAALFDIGGGLFAATDGIGLPPGHAAARHAFFSEYLPRRERGSFIGAGIDGRQVVTAFRTLRKWPVAVLVERDYASVRTELRHVALRVAAACTMALAVIGAMAGAAWRSMRSHEAVRHALESTRARVAASERDLRRLVESVQEVIFRTDLEGRINFINARWQQVSGHLPEAALGRRLSELCQPQQRACIDTLFEPSADRSARTVTMQIQTPAGTARTLEVSLAAVESPDGTLLAFAGFAVDVSERQQARDELQAQLDFTARLLEVSPTPLFVKDAQGRFLSVNRAWLDLMALTLEQVIGFQSADLFGEEAPLHVLHDLRLSDSKDHVRYENRLMRPDRELRDTVVTKVRFANADGTPGGIVGSIIDVTEFREAERRTREARDAAERASRAKSEFLANISHELRTPLQSIIGFAEMGEHLAGDQPALHEMFGDIHAGGRRMLALVNGLLDLSKMESTVGSLRLARGDLAALAGDVVKELRPQAAERGLNIEIRRSARAFEADVDPFRMRQVIRNVLANAIRHAPPGSNIEICCRNHADGGIELAVRDHGPGIPTAELEAIFEAFVQSSRTRDGAGGTGLGLAICRKIMSAHGGTIAAGNAPEGGALMRIRLPRASSDTLDVELPPSDGGQAAASLPSP